MLGFVANSLGFAGILTGPAGNWEKLRICWEKFRIGCEKFRIGWEKFRICNQKAGNKLGLWLEMVRICWDSVESLGSSGHHWKPSCKAFVRFLQVLLGFSRIAWGVLRFVGGFGRILYVPFYS